MVEKQNFAGLIHKQAVARAVEDKAGLISGITLMESYQQRFGVAYERWSFLRRGPDHIGDYDHPSLRHETGVSQQTLVHLVLGSADSAADAQTQVGAGGMWVAGVGRTSKALPKIQGAGFAS